jgi:hypothetical protein
MADFITWHVLPMLLELDTESLVRRAMQSAAKPFHHLTSKELEVADLL